MDSTDGRVYVGLAGETAPGREIRSGLYRWRGDQTPWERLGGGLPPAPQVRAIVVDPARPSRVYVGLQDGVYRSDDQGDHWTPLPAPAPGTAVWSVGLHPRDPEVLLAGYEPAALHRSANGGLSWQPLHLDATFPDVTVRPQPRPKRITGIAVDPNCPGELYCSVEVGGLLRSLDDGKTWEGVTDGLYTTDDAVDLHGVAVCPAHPGSIYVVGRIGMFHSPDRGRHWQHVPVPAMTTRGTYCRGLRVAPDDPDTLYVGAGTAFEGTEGALFKSRDRGRTWTRLDLGATPRSTVFAIAIDARRPDHVGCVAKGGELWRSRDRGATWQAHPLPSGATQVYALALG
jgi:Sortilin, neurotensin receptor 3,